MKCDNCKHLYGESASMEYPYPWVWCGKGHWEGDDRNKQNEENDPWKDCKDFAAN